MAITISAIIMATVFFNRGAKSLPARMLTYMMFSMMMIGAGEMSMILSGTTLRNALFAHYFVMLGTGLFSFFYLYFAIEFPSSMKIREKYSAGLLLAVMFILSMFFFLHAVWAGLDLSDIQPASSGYYQITQTSMAVGGALYWPSIMFLITETLLAIAILSARAIGEKNRSMRLQIALLILGPSIMFCFWPITDYWFPTLSISTIGLPSLGLCFTGIILSYAILKHKIFIIAASIEKKEIDLKNPLERGYTYTIVEEDLSKPVRSYETFVKHVKSGIPGFIITSRNPMEIRKKYSIEKTPIMYVSDEEHSYDGLQSENIVYSRPSALFEAVGPVTDFITQAGESVILVDCYASLVEHNSQTIGQRELLLKNYINFIKIFRRSNTRLITPVDSRWINVDSPMPIVPTKSFMGVDNLWPILLLEHLCNLSLKLLGNRRDDELSVILKDLSRIDRLYNKFIIEDGGISFKYDYTNRFTYHDTIHYYKLFARELRKIASVNENEIIDTLAEFGLSRYEYDLERGHGYLLGVPNNEKCADIFAEFLKQEYNGLYISRSHPKVFKRFPSNIRDRAVFLWLTNIGTTENSVPPRLEHIQREVEDFFDARDGKPIIIILESIPYLVKQEGSFDSVHLFIAKLRDIIAERNGILIVPLSGDIFLPEEKAILTQELTEVDYASR